MRPAAFIVAGVSLLGASAWSADAGSAQGTSARASPPSVTPSAFASRDARSPSERRRGSPLDSAVLRRLVDSVMRVGMREEHIPGASVLIMAGGRPVLERGYGLSDVATRRSVDPRVTRWPFASITKVLTATAVMQLVERGKISLHADVNTYLRSVNVPSARWGPVTTAHLLTHTGALDELPGRQAATRAAVPPLRTFLRTRLERIGPPGQITRYGTYGIALAGVLIEDVSGVSYPEYVRREIFTPLGMRQTTIDLPTSAAGRVATPYTYEDDSLRRVPYEWYTTTPTSSLVSTVSDMGRFMALHLGHAGTTGPKKVLGARYVRDMAAQHASVHPAVPGWGYGWQQSDQNGVHIVEHGGDIGGFSSLLTLLPDEDVGIVVVHHLEGSNLRFKLRRAILDRFYPDRRSRDVRRVPPGRGLAEFAGAYLANNYCRSCENGARRAQRFEIAANGDSTLSLWGDTWSPVGPLLFASKDGSRRIGFMQDSTGNVIAVSAGAWRVLERAPVSPGAAGSRIWSP